MSTSLKALIGKLDDTCRLAAERAASLCMGRGNYEVDLEHLFLALLEQPQSDFAIIAGQFGVDRDAMQKDLESEICQFRTGNTRTPVFSRHLPNLFEHAWLIASLDSRTTHIRSGHLLLALLTESDLSQLTYRGSRRFAALNADELKHRFDELTSGSQERGEAVEFPGEKSSEDYDLIQPVAAGDEARSRTPALDQYTMHLTQRARDGNLDPVIGREAEIRQVVDILTRRRQNNPILTGEAGVGKTAVVEGLALRIVEDDVPPPLQGVELYVLDMGLLQAGASVKGEFENRLKNVIDEVKKSPTPIILFIDEAHTMIGAGGQAGQSDAANLLKPALARGELRTIAATTWSEYKKYFEKDAALARRFQVVKVDEPSEELAAAMLRGIARPMEEHFNVRIVDEAITEAVRLSHRYISGRQLPDKAVGILDTSCARVALAQTATPAVIEDLRKRLDRISSEITALEREVASGSNHNRRLVELRRERDSVEAERTNAENRWHKETELVARIGELRTELEQGNLSTVGAQAVADKAPERTGDGKTLKKQQQKALNKALAELDTLQDEHPLVPIQVDGRSVAAIVASWTGIPLGRMVTDDIRTVRTLAEQLQQRVIGQDHALDAIAQRVRTARAQLEDPDKPQGVFLFVGPSGVGKTETARALADILYGGERKLITINMSEYQEAHTVSNLKGSPPGYVGYGEGGILTEAVRRSPYSVVLLDEVEKAHPDVLEMFYQVFDKGQMEDAEGRFIDFRNTLIILTSNVGSSTIMGSCLNKAEEERPSSDELIEALNPSLYKAFKPAFLGRLKTVAYYPVNDDVLIEIIRLKLDRIADRVRDNHKAEFSADDKLVEAVLARCTEVDSGARNVDHILSGSLLPEIAEAVLARMADGKAIKRIKVSAHKNGRFKYSIT